jgi:hypothetical protein
MRYTIAQYSRIIIAWLASFVRSEWKPESYPIEIRTQDGVPPEAKWCARVLNWPGSIGLGPTKTEARAALLKRLREIAVKRQQEEKSMPRPGTGLPLEFASTTRVSREPALLEDFIMHVLGFTHRDPVFISDESSISDFGDDDRITEIRNKIEEHYGISITESEPVFIADVLERVREKNKA